MGRRIINEEGNHYGKLTVLSKGEKLRSEFTWICRCECGATITVRGVLLRNNAARSCPACRQSAGSLKWNRGYPP